MLGSLSIEGFRSFSSLALGQLGRVNLLVGMNNTGKSSVLEAVEILILGGSASVLWAVPMRRGEVVAAGGGGSPQFLADPRHLFLGHELRKGASFRIRSGDGKGESVTCTIDGIRHIDPSTIPSMPFRFGDVGVTGIGILSSGGESPEIIPLTSEGGLSQFYRNGDGPRIQVLATDHSLSRFQSGPAPELWEKVVLTPSEDRVTSALRIIDPAIERVAAAPRSGFGAEFFLKLSGNEARVPLASTGDGMKRMLAIALAMVTSRDGYVLVDDIDTGLHHSVMRKMWQMVIETARELDVQMFATTHSLDCVTSLASLFEESPHLAEGVAVHRLERGLERTTVFTANDIIVAARHQIELP